MTDAWPGPIGDRKEGLSFVDEVAVAAQAGYGVEMPDSDRDGLDMRIGEDRSLRSRPSIARCGRPCFQSPPKRFMRHILYPCAVIGGGA
ncbi:MAG: hypothetical protein ISN28_13930 [Ectothiorhodospiraceae bacterium AqS1]|nr:hypothetical protein [Ectothiorhodospiraceae bacterium AqS1]